MALQKQVTTKYGVPAEYHKVIDTSINWHNKTATIRVGSFATEEARRSGCSPIGMRVYMPENSDGSTFEVNEPVQAQAYAYLKTLNDFADTIDV